jgi:hypothetical protein
MLAKMIQKCETRTKTREEQSLPYADVEKDLTSKAEEADLNMEILGKFSFDKMQ